MNKTIDSEKKILPAFLLWLFLGVLGVHAFYAGRIAQGVAYPVLFVIGWVGTAIAYSGRPGMEYVGLLGFCWLALGIILIGDLIRIVTGTYTDSQSRRLTQWA